MVTKKELQAQMAALGLVPEDTVLIHTSLRAVGPVEGGADGLIDAFCGYLDRGLFLVPTHTWATVTPEHPFYDVRSEKPCIGTLPCVAAGRSDGIRSMNATHSVWAHGADAAAFTAGEETLYNGTAPDSCWGRLTDRRARILLIGVGHNRNTFIHAVEEKIGVPDRTGRLFEVEYTHADGHRTHNAIRPHYCSRCPDVSANFPNFEPAFDALGVQHRGKLGNAEVRVVDAVRCEQAVRALWQAADCDLCAGPMTIPEAWYRGLSL